MHQTSAAPIITHVYFLIRNCVKRCTIDLSLHISMPRVYMMDKM